MNLLKSTALLIYMLRSRCGVLFIMILWLLGVMMSTYVSAAQVTERSIELSSTSVSASGVTYEVKFTSSSSASAFVIDFCSNSPVVGSPCSSPAGFDASTAASGTNGFTGVSSLDKDTVVVAGAIGANTAVAVSLNGMTNPSTASTLYARIITYDTSANAGNYSSENLGVGVVDEGAVAISITSTVGVTGAVLESITFCVSKVVPSVNCSGTNPPVLELGEMTGDVVALQPENISEGTIHAQISTNAAHGAVVRLKSNAADCGGLIRTGAPSACDIKPALNTGIISGEAKFGIKATPAPDSFGSDPKGIFQPAQGSGYNASIFTLNYVAGNASGITSSFGDPFLDTGGLPVSDKNIALTFGASISNDTPAGQYSANLNLIAVGKF